MTAPIAPVWIRPQQLAQLQEESIATNGGTSGLRDVGLYESAMACPQNRFEYESTTDLATLAAAYAYGLARNHPFVDGNKRAALLSVGLFLGVNGYRLVTSSVDAALTIEKLAAGLLSENELAEWVAARTQKR